MQQVSPLSKSGQKCLRGVIGFLQGGHVLQLRLLDHDTQWLDPHRCQELLFYWTGTSFRRRRQGHPTCTLHKFETHLLPYEAYVGLNVIELGWFEFNA